MLIILALKMRWKTVLNNAETNIFRWDMLFLVVPAGSVSQCFVTYSKNWSFWRARTSVWLLSRWILFTSKAGAHYKPLKNLWLTPLHAMSVLTFDSPGSKFRSRCYTVNKPFFKIIKLFILLEERLQRLLSYAFLPYIQHL